MSDLKDALSGRKADGASGDGPNRKGLKRLMLADEYAPKGWDEAETITVKSETPSTIVGFDHCGQCGSRELQRIYSEGCVSIKCCKCGHCLADSSEGAAP